MSVSKPQQAYDSIMSSVRECNFDGTGIPCQLLLSGDQSFPLVMNSQGHVLMAASQYGSGRIVVFSHETQMYSFPDVTLNALNWLKGESGNMSIGVQKHSKGVISENLHKAGFKVKVMDDFSSAQGVGVYLTYAYHINKDAENIVAFMKSGGGVLIGGQAWWWKTLVPKGNTLLQFEGNTVSAAAGIHSTDFYAGSGRVSIWPQIPTSWKSVDLLYDFKDDLKLLLQEVSQFEWAEASASEILVHGRLSFPIGSTEDGRVFLAGGYYGKGRVVVIAHEALLNVKSMTRFWVNVLHWLDQGRQGIVGVEANALNVMKSSGLTFEQTGFKSGLSVFVRTVYNSDHIKEIQEFVAEGGGLLIGGHAWYWAQTHPWQNYLTEFSGNILLNQMGLTLLSGIIGGGHYKAPDPSVSITERHHFRHLLYRFAASVSGGKELTQHEEKYLSRLGESCASILHMEHFNSYSYQQIVTILTDILKTTGLPQISKSSAKSAKDHFLLNIAREVYKACPNQEELLHYLFKDHPVLQTVENQRISISANTEDNEEWLSTGLYLSPGMKTYISIPTDIVEKGRWQVQISCHTDFLRHQDLKRAPSVVERFPVTSEKMLVHNLWGGLIYLIAPPKTQMTGAEIIVQKAVLAPYYKSGKTSLSEWSVLRTAPSPWAELEFENIILTVPSDVVRDLERPDELAALWDRIMRAIADLAAIPEKFTRKERIVCDVQISAGLYHSGYPIMGHNDDANILVTAKKHQDLWGPLHELGHNQQRGCWEFPSHTTEATCNLWSVYVEETVLKIPREKAHEMLSSENRYHLIKTYIKNGRNLNKWYMWVALITYLQLQEKFGWTPFKSVFRAYHKINNVPSDNRGKMNLYCVTFSETVGMNLTGFFKAWGWPIEGDTETRLSNLPAWTDHPMAKYA